MSGSIYICDKNNHKIKRIAPDGSVSTFAGASPGPSPQGLVDGSASAARFNFPTGIDIDSDGNLYVADLVNHRIRSISPGGVVSTLVGTGGTGTSVTPANQRTDGNVSVATLFFPTDVSWSPLGEIYIADRSNHKIRRLVGTTVSTFAGNGTASDVNGPALNASFRFPIGLTIDNANEVHLIDQNNQKVKKIRNLNPVGFVLGGGEFCQANTPFTLTLTGYPGEPNPSRIVTWQRKLPSAPDTDWVNIPGSGNNPNYSSNTSTASQDSLYRAIVREAVCGELPSNAALVEVSGPPDPTPFEGTACADPGGAPVAVLLRATGGTTDSEYVWLNASRNNLANPNDSLTVNVSTSTDFYVLLNKNGCPSDTILIRANINPVPNPVISAGGQACEGETVSYQSTLNNGNNYAWTVTGGLIVPENSPTVSAQNRHQINVMWMAPGGGTITLIETNGQGCDNNAPLFNETINPKPTPLISGLDNVCEDSPIVYNTPLVPGNTYAWTITGGTIITGGNTHEITVEWQTTGSLSVLESNPTTTCAQTSPTLNVTVNPVPTPVVSGPDNVCAGQTAIYSTPNNVSNDYNWTVSANGSITTGQGSNQITVTWNSNGPGEVSVEETQPFGTLDCPATSAIFNVTVNPLPSPVVSGPDNVCAGQTAIYSTPNNVSNDYNWTVSANGSITTGQGSNQITVTWNSNGPGEVSVEETRPFGTLDCPATSAIFNVTVNPLPVLVVSGEAIACVGDVENYQTNATAGHSYAWTISGGGIITSPSDQAQITVEWTAPGTFTLELTETIAATSCQAVQQFDVEVGSVPAPVIAGNFVICEASTETYTVGATSNTLVWNVINGVLIGGQGSNAISVTWDENAPNGRIELTETDPATGCNFTASQDISFNALPEPAITGASVVCQGDADVLYAVSGPNTDTYFWTITGAVSFTGQGSQEVLVTWASGTTGQVSVLQTDGNACTQTTVLDVSLIAAPNPSIAGNQNLCAGETATYTTSLPPAGQTYLYNWQIVGAGTILSGQGSNQIEVDWNEMIADPTYLLVTIQVEGTDCEATTPIPLDAGSFSVTLNPLPSPEITGPALVCVGETHTYTTALPFDPANDYDWVVTGGVGVAGANPNELVVTWNTAGAGTVNLVETTPQNCSRAALVFNVDVQTSPGLPAVQDRFLCDTSLDVDLSASEPSATDYNWYVSDSEPTPFANGASITQSGITSTTSFWVSALNAAGCEGPRQEVVVNVNPGVLPWQADGLVTDADSCVASGDSPSGRITLTLDPLYTPYTFTWTKDGDPGFSASTQDLSALTQGTYRVTVRDVGGCSQDYAYEVEEALKEITDAALLSSIQVVNDTILIGRGDPLTLEASATDAVFFEWQDSNGNILGTNPVLDFSAYDLESQWLSVRITNDRNCFVILTVFVEAVDLEVFVPNMFSPNGDANNDRFQVYGVGIKSLTLRIFDRLGQLLFETRDWVEGNAAGDTIGWDGTYQGKAQPSGGYVWSLSGRFINDKEVTFNGQKTGSLVLLR
ncbi:MAG: T9SS type B sorting domain-containing protein [Microscillaceae bacterium]|nr:T9SS type B sorting domain-containing protein [Microscillaceae bacterium]